MNTIRKALSLTVIAGATAACSPEPATETTVGSAAPAVTVAMPAGDAAAGRQAFLDLRCTACHAVPSEPGFPAPVSANPGPPVDAQVAGRDVSYLLTAIVSPSHELSPNMSEDVRSNLEGVLSPMGDFSRVMTVRQLVDLSAFVRSAK
jgi:hypothetical protein